MQQTTALIRGRDEVARGHYRLKLLQADVAAAARAGQFAHVLPRRADVYDPMLRRAFSILAVEGDTFDILFRVEGRGTAELSRRRTGEELDIVAPLGRPFAAVPQRAVLVGGGVGVPPLAMLAAQTRREDGRHRAENIEQNTLRQTNSSHDLIAFVGARSKEELLCLEMFADLQVAARVATDDGSAGLHGRVTELLEAHLAAQAGEKHPTIYACGPLPMLRAVAATCARYNAPCQVSLEENMPCGIGVCNGCVVRAAQAGNDYELYKRICVDGPVMWTHELDWQHAATTRG